MVRAPMISRQEILNVAGALIAVGVVWLMGFALWALVFVRVPPENQNALLVVLGAVTTNLTTIVAFYYGTSVGSKKQSDTIDTLASVTRATLPHQPGKVEVAPGEQVKVQGVEAE